MNNERLPVGWIEKPLGKLVTFQKGKKTETSDTWQAGYLRYLGASGLQGLEDGYAATTGAVLAGAKDVLMLWDGERSGLVGCGQVGVVASTVARMAPNDDILPEYLYYFLDLHFAWIQARRTGTGVPHVPKDLGRILSVRYPSDKNRQKKVVDILQSIDMVIHNTLEQINKLSVTKEGMMADLFSRGIDPTTGQLRPSVHDAPELYQETSIGLLPKEWSVVELEKLLADVVAPMRSGPFGSALLKEELVDEGIPLLGIDNIFVEQFNPKYRRFVTPEKFQELSRYAVRAGDVVITIMGTVGRTCVIPDNIGVALSSKHLWTMTFDTQKILPDLVCWQLNYSSWAESWFRRESQGGVMEAIQSQTLKRLKLVVPVPEEQEKLKEIYLNLNDRLNSERKQLAKLKLEKAGLMRDLLTGKVPVSA
ncbi:restriction endonuclease subunit S [Aeromonas enteropelogenes]|uniref:restriction endonuclease subunit S n=1 Tax=Aeromonas enteropelogenes TaxID=29489 RepID=UPI00228542D9|nr:restriction endonuclease subunit S [Aeromonas enteropelogenes]MCZ0749993.1 restriction endonuclease subunit S [Aeromonas enteropelogenes]